ncbi:MAG: diguanylate cyclase [Gallionella sp.]|jgi:diguanylate cyclase (GGDEF)-like protein/PAS domain S-box-containing protein
MSIPLEISRDLLTQAVDQSNDGITIADARQKDWPLIYANAGFERLTGYPTAEVLGKSCNFLQGEDTLQPEISVLRDALQQGKSCMVTLRNYRRDGSMFWNELSISAIHDEATLTHFIGIQKDVTERVLRDQHLRQSNKDLHALNQQLLTQTKPPADIRNRLYFDDQLHRMLQTAQRTHSLLSVLLINLNQFHLFNDRYGRAAGDACLRMVGERIARSFARASDCVARYDGDEFAVVSMGDSIEGLKQHLQRLRDQIRALNIPHSDSPYGVMSICVSGISLIPQRDTTTSALLKQADTALQNAKKSGSDCEYIVS